MAIKAYIGIMGSGKTYEVASVVIYEAIKQGRRVVSNIAGLNQDEYYRLLLEEGHDVTKLGKIVSIPHATVLIPEFWLTDKFTGVTLPDFDKTVNENADYILAGDLVVLDEIWRFWDGFALKDSNGLKRPDSVMNFFRMHRQMVHPVTGVTCDIALITQDISDLHRNIKGVVEETYRMTKLTALGLTSRYRVDVYQRAKIVKESLRSYQRSYHSKFFNLYQSHSQKKEGSADAKEVNIDKRGNLLNGKLFVIVLPVLLIITFFSLRYVWGFFHQKPKAQSADVESTAKPNVPVAAQSSVPVLAASVSPWRIVGYYTFNGTMPFLMLQNSSGQFRRVYSPNSLTVAGLSISAVVDGENVNNWSNSFNLNTGRGASNEIIK